MSRRALFQAAAVGTGILILQPSAAAMAATGQGHFADYPAAGAGSTKNKDAEVDFSDLPDGIAVSHVDGDGVTHFVGIEKRGA